MNKEKDLVGRSKKCIHVRKFRFTSVKESLNKSQIKKKLEPGTSQIGFTRGKKVGYTG